MTQATPPAGSTAARRVLRAIEELRKIDPDMQAQTVAVFFLIAAQPEITAREIQDYFGFASSSATRNVAILTDVGARSGNPGLNLVVATPSINDRRIKHLSLSHKGRMVLRSIERLMGEE